MPFAGYELSSRHRGPNQKGLPKKRIRKASEKKSSDVARAPEKNFECLSCDANVLITAGDKGWREYGSHVVLELFEHNEWKLSVKVLGVTRYSYKALQFIQLGSTNRYTHAMMWKGDKDWILEFPDRSQWALFKEMHEECYNRNQSAVDINIPFQIAPVACSIIHLLGIISVMSQVFIVFIPMTVISICYQKYCIPSGRELSRLLGVCEAPVIQHLAETISGFISMFHVICSWWK